MGFLPNKIKLQAAGCNGGVLISMFYCMLHPVAPLSRRMGGTGIFQGFKTSSPLKPGDTFDVIGLREKINRLGADEFVKPAFTKELPVAR